MLSSRKNAFTLHYKNQNEFVKLDNLFLLRLWVENLQVLYKTSQTAVCCPSKVPYLTADSREHWRVL